MKFVTLIKKSLTTVLINPSIILFLVLFLIVSNFFSSHAFYSKNPFVVLIVTLCTLLLTSCFFAGWFNVIKDIVLDFEKQDKNYFPVFFEGVGRNVIPVAISGLIYTGIFFLILVLASKIATHFFGNLEFLFKDLVTISQNNSAFIEYFNNLTVNQKYAIYGWEICFVLAGSVFNFFMFYYFPAIIFETRGNVFQKPFIGFVESFKFLFKNFFQTLGLFLFFYLIYFTLGVFRALFANNFLISIIILFIYIGFICSVIMIVFNYYGQKNNYTDGCDSVRENENIDKISEEN